jgi:hypothetical protein
MNTQPEHLERTASAAVALDARLRSELATGGTVMSAGTVDSHLAFVQLAEAADPVVRHAGRLIWVKRLFAKLLRPYLRRQATFNQGVVGQLAELRDEQALIHQLRAEITDAVAAEVTLRLAEARRELESDSIRTAESTSRPRRAA